VVDHDQGSTSLLQRRLRVGYSRAARILDQLERANIVGPPDGTKPRDVLITSDDLETLEASSL
jgi:S-DNA-T family DNA segregation ATPase FtsK/SpoIIIE